MHYLLRVSSNIVYNCLFLRLEKTCIRCRTRRFRTLFIFSIIKNLAIYVEFASDNNDNKVFVIAECLQNINKSLLCRVVLLIRHNSGNIDG